MMETNNDFICSILDTVMTIPRTGPLHNYYHSIAKQIATHLESRQLYLLIRRTLAGTDINNLSFWIYSAGLFLENEIIESPILEISINESPFLKYLYNVKKHKCDVFNEQKLRDKFYRACNPVKSIDEKMFAFSFDDSDGKLIATIFIPESEKEKIDDTTLNLLDRVFQLIFMKIDVAYEESNLLKTSLTSIAGQFLKIAENQDPTSSDDVLQAFLNFCREKMNAEKCALFLVDYLYKGLSLERISKEGNQLHYEEIPRIVSYDVEHYDESMKKQGVTLWVFMRKQPFNARSYEELKFNSEGQHLGNWDKVIYETQEKAEAEFQCVYMTPLLANNKAIGVLKFENRTKNSTLSYFDQADEREIDVIGEVVTNIVLSQRIERNRYDRALPEISETMITYFGQQIFYQKLLEKCQELLKAEFCSLFLVSSNRNDLELKEIVGIETVKKESLTGFKYSDYNINTDSMTPWILQKKLAFNVRTYQDLIRRSEGHHVGRWDETVYDNDTENRFRSLYSIPLTIGGEDIGVLKVENKQDAPYYFTDSDERLFDMIGRLIAIGVKYDQHQYLFGIMQRNSELGFLASGIAHEFNNYLQVIINKGALLTNRGDVFVREIVRDLNDQINMAKVAIEHFQAIRTRTQSTTTFSLNEVLQQIINISMQRFIDHDIQFELINHHNISVTMNPAELQTLIINLIKNAEDAITLNDIKNKFIGLTVLVDDKSVTIQIADSGGGISSESTDHLFAPYVSFKEKGMGMGLFWVGQIVEKNKGTIEITRKNKYGGATFSVTFKNVIKPN